MLILLMSRRNNRPNASDSVARITSHRGVAICGQKKLFDYAALKPATAPPGFRYQAEFLTEAEEEELAAVLGTLSLKPFEFHGHVGNRRVVSFGLRYDYSRREVRTAEDPPAFLRNLCVKGCAIHWIRSPRF